MYKLDVVIFALCVIGVLCNVPRWHRSFERRFIALEKKVHEESLEFRHEILLLLDKLDAYGTADDVNVTSVDPDTGHGEQEAVKGSVDISATAAVTAAIAEAIAEGFRAEKQHLRRYLTDIELTFAKFETDQSAKYQDLERYIQTEIRSVRQEISGEIAAQTQIMQRQETAHMDVKLRLTAIEHEFNESLTTVMDRVDNEMSFFTSEIQSVKSSIDGLSKTATSELQTGLANIRKENEQMYQRNCESSWYLFGGSCYYLSTASASWWIAETRCKEMGGYLAEVDSHEEMYFLKILLKQREAYVGQYSFWIGASDLKYEGNWRWSRGRWVSYTDWSSDEPNGGYRENCAELNHRKKYEWNDTVCPNSIRYICEK